MVHTGAYTQLAAESPDGGDPFRQSVATDILEADSYIGAIKGKCSGQQRRKAGRLPPDNKNTSPRRTDNAAKDNRPPTGVTWVETSSDSGQNSLKPA